MDKSYRQPNYQSYLMRLWRVGSGRKTTWRASLESTISGKTHHFVSLECLCAFLRDQTDHALDASKDEEEHTTTVILMIHQRGHGRRDR